MRQSFVKNILFILTINLVVKSVWIFMIDRTVQNRVGHSMYGSYIALLNLSGIFLIILDFGLNNYNSRIISQSPARLNKLFPRMLSARLFLMLFYAVAVMGAGLAIGYRGTEIMMLGSLLLMQSLSIILQFIRSNVAALQRFKIDGILSVTDRFLMIMVCGSLLFLTHATGPFRVEWFIYSQIACYAVTIVVAFIVLKKVSKLSFSFSFDLGEIVNVVKKSFPFALLIFLMSVYTRSDAILIERLCGSQGKEQAGVYASAYRLLDVGNIFGLMFANMLQPLFGNMLAKKENLVPVIRTSVNMMIPISVMVSVASVFYGSDIMQLLYKEANGYDGKVFGWYMSCFPAFCVMYVYSTLLTVSGNLSILNKIALAGAIINLSLNFYMIPHYQALGAGMVALVTQVLVASGFIIYARKKLDLPFNLRWLLTHIGYMGSIAIVAYLVRQLAVGWMISLMIYGLIGLTLIFVFRFISPKSLKMLTAVKSGKE